MGNYNGNNPAIYETSLRNEAQPLKEFTDSQKKAFCEIVNKLKASYYALCKDDASENDSNYRFPIYQYTHNQMVFLTGPKGSGKTSLLFSLMQKSRLSWDQKSKESARMPQFCEECPKKEKKIRTEKEMLLECQDLFDQLIWLDILDMNPLPGPTNLLAAIFKRIENTIKQFRALGPNEFMFSHLGSNLEPSSEYQEVISELGRLERDVALAWDGNLPERAANIDPDTFAVEVLRAEQSRLRLMHRLRKLMNKFAKLAKGRFINPLFVLPVDDFDLNPIRCVELFRLLRMISVPRLFIVILGDIEMVHKIFQMQIGNELSLVGFQTPLVPLGNRELSRSFSTYVSEISANAIRKLIPPINIIELELPYAKEGLDFKPFENQESIGELLKKIPVQLNILETENKKRNGTAWDVHNLLKFLDPESIVQDNTKKGEHRKVYCVHQFFKLPPRHLSDLWLYLKEGIHEPDTSGSEAAIRLAIKLFKESFMEDHYLTPDRIEDIISTVEPDFEGNNQFNTSLFDIEDYLGPDIEKSLEERSFVARQAKDWFLRFKDETRPDSNKINLHTVTSRTERATALLHDLLVLKQPRGIVGDSLMKRRKPLMWAYAKWDMGARGIVEIPWPTPPWLSFWQYDFMRQGWNEVWTWFRGMELKLYEEKLDPNPSATTAFFAFAWIKMGTIIVAGDHDPSQKMILYTADQIKSKTDENQSCFNMGITEDDKKKIEKMFPTLQDWLELVSWLSKLSESTSTTQSPLKKELIEGWLVRIACILAPESGVPTRIRSLFFGPEGYSLRKFWRKQYVAREIRKIRARSAVEFKKKGDEVLLKKLFNPMPIEDIAEREKILAKRAKTKNEIEDEIVTQKRELKKKENHKKIFERRVRNLPSKLQKTSSDRGKRRETKITNYKENLDKKIQEMNKKLKADENKLGKIKNDLRKTKEWLKRGVELIESTVELLEKSFNEAPAAMKELKKKIETGKTKREEIEHRNLLKAMANIEKRIVDEVSFLKEHPDKEDERKEILKREIKQEEKKWWEQSEIYAEVFDEYGNQWFKERGFEKRPNRYHVINKIGGFILHPAQEDIKRLSSGNARKINGSFADKETNIVINNRGGTISIHSE